MNTTPRKMPSELAIRAHWAKRLWAIKGFDSEAEFLERGTCFACGMDGSERAHIVARSVGGSDGCENLHILCGVCHKDSEYLDGERYMAWLVQRSPVDRLMSGAIRCGFNPATMMQLKYLGAVVTAIDIKHDCHRFGAFHSERVVYDCKERK